ncbi:MAG TPA: hypothetical protein VHU19_14320 [Pyrinomonadaceae bacterium]|jgi:hypothetical protein|nr:hypothetical protein [Pyrinomonadaceae bacterium]
MSSHATTPPQTPAAGLPPSTPEKSKRDRVSTRRRRRGLELLQELYLLDAKFGEFSALLAPAIQAVKHAAERTRVSDRDQVLIAIEQGNFRKDEICRSTGLSEWDARKILEELEDLDLVEVSRQRRPDCDAGDGVPVLLYTLTHSPAVLP